VSQQTQWREPSEFAAGDTLSFSKRLSDYPASEGWSLKYELRLSSPAGGGQAIEFTSTANPDGSAHDVSVTAAVTGTWLPGDYVLRGYAIKALAGGQVERHQIYDNSFTLLEDLPSAAGSEPQQTFAQKMIAQLETVMLAKAGDDLQRTAAGETGFWFWSPEDLRKEHGYWTQVRRQEVAKLNAKAGRPTGNKVRPLFRVVSSGPASGSTYRGGYGGW
jgi:hypothetical protein